MAVPGSGQLSLFSIANEKLSNDYNDGDNGSGPYSLRDITQGGDQYGNGEDYDETNEQSPNHPDNNAGFGMGEFYAYDHDFQAIPCNKAMDVVFIIDYTGSMGDDFNDTSTGLKANITAIINKIVARSGGDYRLGMVIVDAIGSSNVSSLNYSSSSTYSSLPSANKHHQEVPTNGHIHSTAIVKFAYANATDFSTKLNLLAAADNNNGNMLLGAGQSTVGWEVCLNQVLNNDFAGTFRTDVQRMIVFVTDTSPEGTSTRGFNGAEETALMGTLSSQAVEDVCTISIIGSIPTDTSDDGTTSAHTIYDGYANNTGGLTDFTADPSGIIQFIEDICDTVETGFATFTDITLHSTNIDSTPDGTVGATSPTATNFTAKFTVSDINNNATNYWKPWAINTAGTSYGDLESVNASKWTANAEVTSTTTITSRGFVYSNSPDNLTTAGTSVTTTGGTNTYSQAIVNNQGLDSLGWTYANAGFTQTPTVSYNNGTVGNSTGCQTAIYLGSNNTTGVKTQTVTENEVPLNASSTYKLRGWFEQKDNGGIVYSSNIATFTVPATYNFTSTMTVGNSTAYSTTAYGYSNRFPFFMGSLSNASFNSSTITALYWQDSSVDYMHIYFSGTRPTFTNLVINGTSLGASTSWTTIGSDGYRKAYGSNIFGQFSGGFATIQATY